MWQKKIMSLTGPGPKSRQRKSLEVTTAQRGGQGGQLNEQRWGADSLPMTVTCSSATSRDHMPDEVRRWRMKRRN